MKKRVITLFLIIVCVVSIHSVIASACTDSDGGMNYAVKGYVTVNYDLDSGTEGMQNIAGNDICIDDTLKEFYCDSSDAPKIKSYECPNGCIDGMCINEFYIVVSQWNTDKNGNLITHTMRYENGSVAGFYVENKTGIIYGKGPDKISSQEDRICNGDSEYDLQCKPRISANEPCIPTLIIQKDYTGLIDWFKKLFGWGFCQQEYKNAVNEFVSQATSFRLNMTKIENDVKQCKQIYGDYFEGNFSVEEEILDGKELIKVTSKCFDDIGNYHYSIIYADKKNNFIIKNIRFDGVGQNITWQWTENKTVDVEETNRLKGSILRSDVTPLNSSNVILDGKEVIRIIESMECETFGGTRYPCLIQDFNMNLDPGNPSGIKSYEFTAKYYDPADSSFIKAFKTEGIPQRKLKDFSESGSTENFAYDIKINEGVDDSLFNPQAVWSNVKICKTDKKAVNDLEQQYLNFAQSLEKKYNTIMEKIFRDKEVRMTKEEFEVFRSLSDKLKKVTCEAEGYTYTDQTYEEFYNIH